MNKTYCIRDGYIPNTENHTFEREGVIFWSESRLHASLIYQWPAYVYAKKIVVGKKIENVLDIGCGPARKLMHLLGDVSNVHGIDQASAIKYCVENYSNGNFYIDNFENPQLILSVEFGLIICSDVIEHIEDPDILLAYIKKFCGPNTLVIISTPDRKRARGENCLHCPQKEHIREWSKEELIEYLAQSGFDIIEHCFQAPLKPGISIIHLRNWFYQLSKGLSLNYNQVALCKVTPTKI